MVAIHLAIETLNFFPTFRNTLPHETQSSIKNIKCQIFNLLTSPATRLIGITLGTLILASQAFSSNLSDMLVMQSVEDCPEALLLRLVRVKADCRSIRGDLSKGRWNKLLCPFPGETMLVFVPGKRCTIIYNIGPLLWFYFSPKDSKSCLVTSEYIFCFYQLDLFSVA